MSSVAVTLITKVLTLHVQGSPAFFLRRISILAYYANYFTNMAQMSLIKHERGIMSPISIFIVFPGQA